MSKYLCEKGDIIDRVSKSTEKSDLKEYTSRNSCTLHDESCSAVCFTWPVEKIESIWADIKQLKDPLLKEATFCKCGKKGRWLCLYGGHMVCDECSIAWIERKKSKSKKIKTRSPYECRVCIEASSNMQFPLWPNPFAHMYLFPDGCVLQQGIQTHLHSFIDGKISLFEGKTGPRTFVVRNWDYEHDRNPQQITYRATKIVSTAWRVDISPGEPVPLYLDTCRCMWMNAVPSVTLQKVMTRAEHILDSEDGWTIISHPEKLFMYLEHFEKGILCLGCLSVYKDYSLFSASLCCLFRV